MLVVSDASPVRFFGAKDKGSGARTSAYYYAPIAPDQITEPGTGW